MTIRNSKVWAEEMSRVWSAFTPPERPSAGEIEIYEDYLKKIIAKRGKNISALLLGATPELRDLLAIYNVKTTCADINPSMIEAMNKLLEFSDGKEKIVITDWLKIPKSVGKFDIILGDHSIHWIPFEKWDDFFENKKKVLKNGGYMIFNVVTAEESESITVEKMLEIYRNKKFFTREERFYYLYLAMLGLKDRKRNARYAKNFGDYNGKLQNFKKKGRIDSKDYEILRCPWSDEFTPVTPPKSEVDKFFNKYFTLKSVMVSNFNIATTCHKIYFMQKK